MLNLISNNDIIEVHSIYRFEKERLGCGDTRYSYIIFYESKSKAYTEEGPSGWTEEHTGGVCESYLITDGALGITIKRHKWPMFNTYAGAFWGAHKYEYEAGFYKNLYSKDLSKEEYFAIYNKYFHLTI